MSTAFIPGSFLQRTVTQAPDDGTSIEPASADLWPHAVAALRRAQAAATVHDSPAFLLGQIADVFASAGDMLKLGRVDAAIDILADVGVDDAAAKERAKHPLRVIVAEAAREPKAGAAAVEVLTTEQIFTGALPPIPSAREAREAFLSITRSAGAAGLSLGRDDREAVLGYLHNAIEREERPDGASRPACESCGYVFPRGACEQVFRNMPGASRSMTLCQGCATRYPLGTVPPNAPMTP